MKKNSGNVKNIYDFFNDKGKAKLRKAFLQHYGHHEQTFYNKLNPNKLKSYFAGEEVAWIIKWATENGMPLSAIEEQKQKVSA